MDGTEAATSGLLKNPKTKKNLLNPLKRNQRKRRSNMWAAINLMVGLSCLKISMQNHCRVYAVSFLCLLTISMLLSGQFLPDNFRQFIIGVIIYSIPLIICMGSRFNYRKAWCGSIFASLLSLEVAMLIAYVNDWLQFLSPFYQPIAFLLYMAFLAFNIWEIRRVRIRRNQRGINKRPPDDLLANVNR